MFRSYVVLQSDWSKAGTLKFTVTDKLLKMGLDCKKNESEGSSRIITNTIYM